MQGLEDHCFTFISYEFFNALPAQPANKWSAWVVKAAVGYKNCFITRLYFPPNGPFQSFTFLCFPFRFYK